MDVSDKVVWSARGHLLGNRAGPGEQRPKDAAQHEQGSQPAAARAMTGEAEAEADLALAAPSAN